MAPRIQPLLRLAQRQGPVYAVSAHRFPARSLFGPPPISRLRLSTSAVRRQEPRQSPASANAAAAADSAAPSHPAPADPTPAQQPKPKSRRLAPRLILAMTCLLIGAAAGSSMRLVLSPPAPPEPHTEQDAYTTRVLHEQAAKLPIVQQLTAESSSEEGDGGAWESWDAYSSLTPEHRAQHLTAGTLGGSRGVGGYQRVWRHRGTGEVVSVVYFGAATAGWPGVVHGGCLATILDESCGRAAFLEWGGRPGMTACLGLEYKKVTLANGFYVVRTRVRPEEELPEAEKGKRRYKCWVDATVEDAATGAVTVVAEALFVGGEGKDGKGAGWDEKARTSHVKF